MSTPQPLRPSVSRIPALLVLLPGLLGGPPSGASAQVGSPMSRLEVLDLERIELGGVTVVYSAAGPASLEYDARRTGAFLAEAVGFFDARLGEGLHVIVAVLNARDFRTVSMGRHARTFSAPVDRLVVVPAGAGGFVLEGGQDRARAHGMHDVIGLHELSHAVAAAYLYPAGFDDDRPPVRWFDELIASYLAHAYMREAMPRLADFAQSLARDMIRTGAPHFASLAAYERHYGEYTATPQGTNTLDWFHNVFNRQAAELYDKYGLDFFREVRRRLPWMRYELWTTDSLLRDLEGIAPGFLAWAEELEYLAPRR